MGVESQGKQAKTGCLDVREEAGGAAKGKGKTVIYLGCMKHTR